MVGICVLVLYKVLLELLLSELKVVAIRVSVPTEVLLDFVVLDVVVVILGSFVLITISPLQHSNEKINNYDYY